VRETDVLVLGAGASGLMAALTVARRGRRVVLLDHAGRTGSKVRISGGGRCNVTNLRISADNYLGENPHFVKSALARHTPRDVLAFLDQHGLHWHEEEGGKIFLRAGGGELANLLERECVAAGAELLLGRSVGTVMREGERFRTVAGEEVVLSDRVVVATGGLSWPKLGASDLGLRLAKRFGHRIVPPRPGLVPLTVPNWPLAQLSGISLCARVSCSGASFTDGLLVTHQGVSGPAVLQVSSFFSKGEVVALDLLPDQEVRDVLAAASGKMLCKNVLASVLPIRLVEALLPAVLAQKQAARLSNADRVRIAGIVHGWEIRPSGTEGWAKAEVTVGGVDTSAVSSKTMESRHVPGLFFVGEVLDVTGWLGGYNLQWAWSSGAAAGAVA
jgi:predicted Rossmann fold flavoprotein